jgi:plastocyanin
VGGKQMGKQTFKKTLAILLVVLFTATLTAASVSAQKTVDVSIQGFAFNPASVQISTGDTVKWTNMDSVDHTVTGSTFNSGMIHTGQSFEFRFTTPGVFDYHCSIHPSMKGTVTVA